MSPHQLGRSESVMAKARSTPTGAQSGSMPGKALSDRGSDKTVAVESRPAKFDETVEMAMRLGVDPRQADQNVRGTVVLPHGTGKTVARPRLHQGRQGARGARRPAPISWAAMSSIKKITSKSWLESTRDRHARHDGRRRQARQRARTRAA